MRTMISFQCETLEEAHAVIEAVAAIGKKPHACSKQYVPPEELQLGHRDEPAKVEERENFSPGVPTITKIGSNTLEQIIGMLNDGNQPPEKYSEHLKLLWARGKVKFDGEYYL